MPVPISIKRVATKPTQTSAKNPIITVPYVQETKGKLINCIIITYFFATKIALLFCLKYDIYQFLDKVYSKIISFIISEN